MKIENSKKINVAILIRNFDKSIGGAEKYCVELSEKLAQIYNVHVFSQNIKERSVNIHFHRIPLVFSKPRFLNQIFFSIYTKLILKDEFDIVHSHDIITHANIYTLHVTPFKNINRYSQFFTFSPRILSYLLIERKMMKFAENKRLVCVSEYLAKKIKTVYPETERMIRVSLPGIHQKSISYEKKNKSLKVKLGLKNDDFLFVFVGNSFKRKGLQSVIDAFERLDDKSLHIAVVGSGDPNSIDFNLIEIKKNFHFLGVQKNMDDIYKDCDAIIHPTYGDTFGMAVLEAMSHKLPVIVSGSKYCGLSEKISHNEAIVIKNPSDIDELKKAIKKISKDSELRNNLSKKSFQKSQTLSWENTLKSTVEIYNEFLIEEQKRSNV